MARQKIDVWRGVARLPLPIYEWLQARAAANYRTINGEMVEIFLRTMEQEAAAWAPVESKPADLLQDRG